MDNFALSGWMFVFLSVVAVNGALEPGLNHLFLDYISPFQFLKGYGENAALYAYQPFRVRRSAASSHAYHPMPHPISNPMSYAYGFGYNPMYYNHQNMMGFPSFRFPMMPGFNLMHYGPTYPYMYSAPKQSAGMKPAAKSYDTNMGYNSNMGYGNSYVPAYKPMSHPFGHDFMKMMGFNINKINSAISPLKSRFNFNNNNIHTPSFDSGRFNFDKMNFPKPAKGGKNYDMSYSSSYSMDMDYKDGKGHMVTKDSSMMNDNGKVEVHDNPARHFTFTGNGKPVPMDNADYHRG